MARLKIYLVSLLGGLVGAMNAYAANNSTALMTASDMVNNSFSNITLTNGTGKTITATGIFIASYDTNDCTACFGSVTGGDNAAGTLAETVTIYPNQSIPVGQNYLYNMLYNGLYFAGTNIPTPCKLPGCSWPGDDPSVHGWCISMNITSLDSSYTFSFYTNGIDPPSNFPAYAASGLSTAYNYNYDLIDPSTLGTGSACMGLVVCDDKTLTCTSATPSNEVFQPF